VHQVLHLAPVAAILSRRFPDLNVTCLHRDDETAAMLNDVRRNMNAFDMTLRSASPPRWSALLGQTLHRPSVQKLPVLFDIARHYRHARAVIVPERTSTYLRKMGMKHPSLIHFRHGAGDRAPKSEERLQAFDLIVVPGEKDIDRAVKKHHVDRDRLRSCGCVKIDYLQKYGRSWDTPLFDNERPVVFYNPHFDMRYSSWGDARGVIERFRRQDRYNLVVAPHVRLGETLSAHEREGWEAMSVPGKIIVDLNSRRMVDMSYIMAADVYLGDVSSQLYEFLYSPRPVAFLNTHNVDWADDPRYAGWRLGAVADSTEDVLAAIDRAVSEHAQKVTAQKEAVAYAFGDWRGASQRGAEIIGAFLGARDRTEAGDSAFFRTATGDA
jgi:hypothetical protein